jgi:beta-glucanase (GH16 family)
LKRSWAAGLACALALTSAGIALTGRHLVGRHQPGAATDFVPDHPGCSERGERVMAPVVHSTIVVGWSRRWVSSTAPIVDGRGDTWEPDALIARGGTLRNAPSGATQRVGVQCYILPIPVLGTWIATFGVGSPSDGGATALALTATGASGVVHQNADISKMRHVTIAVPAAEGRMRVSLETAVGHTVITSVTLTLARKGTQPPKIVFSDDFQGTRLDDTKWRTETGNHGWGNRELQSYTSKASNILVNADRLAITARRERAPGRPDSFTSARLDSRFSAAYGHIEARIRTPGGAGLLPAFWMLGADQSHLPWPNCGEIDIMESLGQREPSTVHASLHGPDHRGKPWELTTSLVTAQELAEDFHTYTLDWWPHSIQMSFDGKAYASYAPEDLPPTQRWPFDKPYYLLLNVAVGGDWPGTPSPALRFPQAMQVDFVRWWR